MDTVIFLHLDTHGSGDYTWLREGQGRLLSTQLARWAANMMRDRGAVHAEPRGGDAVNAVCTDFQTALRVSNAIGMGWRAHAEELKRSLRLTQTPVDWPGFRIVMAADYAELKSSSVLDDNAHVWEAITQMKGFAPNSIACRANVVPKTDLLKESGFHPVLRPIPVRKGGGSETWSVFVQLEPIRLAGYAFDGELLSLTTNALPPNRVTATVNLDYSAVTKSAFDAIGTDYPLWKADDNLFPGIIPSSVLDAFEVKNRQRELDRESGVSREYGGVTPLLRLIADPHVGHSVLDFQLAPLSWELFSVRVPYPNVPIDKVHGRYVPTDRLLDEIERFMKRLPEVHPHSQGGWPLVGPRNLVPMGLEVLVVSQDRRALLRRKDRTTTVSPDKWDVSFSGYARFRRDFGLEQTQASNVFEINIRSWVSRELEREVGLHGNTEGLQVFGIHRNRQTGAFDLLGFLSVDVSAKEIARSLHMHREEDRLTSQHRAGAFSESELAARLRRLVDAFEESWELPRSDGVAEREVFGTSNRFVPFSPEGIGRFLLERRRETSEQDDWGVLPEALATLLCSIVHVYGAAGRDEVLRWVEGELQ